MITFLTQMIDLHGRPSAIRCDNGPELTSQMFIDWCKLQDIELRFIQPGKPDQNAYIERFKYGSAAKDYGFKRWFPEAGFTVEQYEREVTKWEKIMQGIVRRGA